MVRKPAPAAIVAAVVGGGGGGGGAGAGGACSAGSAGRGNGWLLRLSLKKHLTGARSRFSGPKLPGTFRLFFERTRDRQGLLKPETF